MQSTNKFRATLSLITIGLLACTVFAVADSDNYAENFEALTVGTAITNVSGWTATSDSSVIVSTNYSANYVGGVYPIPGAHTKALQIDNGVANTIAPGDSNQTNWVDVVVKPVLTDTEPEMPTAGALAACYFNASSNLVVMHSPSYGNLAWLEIPDVSLAENEWIRLTIAANMADGDDFDDFVRYYQIYINATVVTNAAAYQLPSSLSGTGGSWFLSGAPITRTGPITNVTISGTGYLDDLVVTSTAPTQTPPTPAEASYIDSVSVSNVLTFGQTVAEAGLSGTATNGVGDPVVGTFAFDTPSEVPAVGTNTYDVTFTPDDQGSYLDATGSVDVVVVAADGPPASWLANTGVDSENLDVDLRGDGMTPRQAWLASTDPTNTTFSFEMTEARNANGTNTIEWISVFVDTNLPPFEIWALTNLMDTTYNQLDTYPRTAGETPSTPVTNVWSHAAPVYSIFYRVAATNAP